MMDDEIQLCKTYSEHTQSYQVAIPVPFVSFRSKSFGLAYCWVQSHWKTTADLFNTQHSIQFARIKRSFISACVLIFTFDDLTSSFRMACWFHILTVKVPLLHQTNQTKQRLEQDALLPLVSSIHQCIGTCNAFQMSAYVDFNQLPQNSVEAHSDFRDLQGQLLCNEKHRHENTNDDNAKAPSTTISTLHNRMTPSLSFKYIVESISVGARFDPTIFRAFKFIVVLTSFANFQLIVEFNAIPHSERECNASIIFGDKAA